MRVFWLGMHKILIQTELPRLRSLGFEVFCPRYTDVTSQHQSAANGWTLDQPTSLPSDVFDRLSTYNFFYNAISKEVASLLNEYFDFVIVTIDPAWLIEILKIFKGKVVYRTYGHVVNMSKYLLAEDAFRLIVERDNFWYVPHSLECALHEDSWLRDRMEVVPYCVSDSILQARGQWVGEKREIMVSCPNIANSYFLGHYKYLKQHFQEAFFRYYGVQTEKTSDSQIVGTISFEKLLEAYKEASGFLYTYKEQTVCFLPPIEMMIVGGPVIYFKGSLLDQYFGEMHPGRAGDEVHAKALCERLLAGDKEFISQLLSSQESVRDRYLPEKVWPLFDKFFVQFKNRDFSNFGIKRIVDADSYTDCSIKNFLLLDRVDLKIDFSEGTYHVCDPAYDAILRDLHNMKGRVAIILLRNQLPYWWSFLRNFSNIVFTVLDDVDPKFLNDLNAPRPEGLLRQIWFYLTKPRVFLYRLKRLIKSILKISNGRSYKRSELDRKLCKILSSLDGNVSVWTYEAESEKLVFNRHSGRS